METVGIPAGTNGRVCAHVPVGVQLEREAQQLEPAVVEHEITVAVQLAREHGRARAVPGVAAIVLAPRVVQQPNANTIC